MELFFDMLGRLCLFAALGVPGFLLAKWGKIGQEGRGTLVNLLLYVAMPCLVFAGLLETDVRALHAAEWITCALFPALIVAVIGGLGALIFRGEGDRPRLCRFCAAFANCGFLGLPLAQSLFPDRPAVALFISIFNILSTVLLFIIGGAMLSGDGGKQKRNWFRLLVSPLTVATLLGVICSLLHVGQKLPFLITFAEIPAAMTTPLSMTVLGALLATLPKKPWWRESGLWLTALLKLAVAPLCTMGILAFLRSVCKLPIGADASLALLLSTAVSTAASAPSMAEDHGRDPHYAAALTLGNTLLCLLTLPFAYLLFNFIFGT
ncbi:MAG: AEC family transporter [Clostridia bacterium]|nr:AEC family transporter [Clostridia bacterium]